jgi:beta-lactamase class A
VSSPSRELFGRTLRRVLGDDAGVVAVSVLDRRTGARWHHRGEVPVPLASSAKILVVAAAMLRARDQGRGLTDQERDQARLAITESDNDATDALYLRSGGHDAVAGLARRLGMVTTVTPVGHWSRTLGTTDELVTLLRALTSGSAPLASDDTKTLLGHMASVTDGQRWGVGTVGSRTVRARLKNGWMTLDPTPGRPWQVNSVGDVRGGGRDYVLAIAQQAQRTQFEGFELASRIGRTVHAALREPIR